MALGKPDRKRTLEHVINRVTSELLRDPRSNPEGFILTVHLDKVAGEDSFIVTGTAPAYPRPSS